MSSLPSIWALMAGNSAKAVVTALVKKPMNPRPTPNCSRNASLCFLRKSITGFMSTSLKVVNMAVSFFTETKRSATFRRSMLIFSRRVSRLPSQPERTLLASNPAASAANTSCFSTRPSRPEP